MSCLDEKLNYRDWYPIWDDNVAERTREYHRWCAIERDNCREALRYSLEEQEGAKAALRLGARLWRFWHRHGHYSEGRTWLNAALQKDDGSPSRQRLMALYAAGLFANLQTDAAPSRRFAEEALAMAREHEPESVVQILDIVWHVTTDWDKKQPICEEQVALARQNGDPRLIADALNTLARTLMFTGHEDEVRPVLEESLDYASRSVEPEVIITAKDLMAMVLLREGKPAEALRLAQEVVSFREVGNPFGLGYSCIGLATIHRQMGDFAAMRAHYGKAIRLFLRMGHTRGVITTLSDIAAGEYGALPMPCQQDAERAARLLGASERHAKLRNLHPGDFPAARLENSPDHDLFLHMRVTLGEEAFTRAWAKGAEMSLEEAVEYALREEENAHS